ncbi:MAG: ATP-grasp domain-containing protein [Dermatophilaceae bacterium]
MAGRLGWVTTGAARGRDDDEPLALTALRDKGVEASVVDWDDPVVDWAAFDRVVLRSTWDYAERLPAFLDWLERVGRVTDVRNPTPMVRWSLDKHYLAELAGAGIPIISTTFVEPGEADIPVPLLDGHVVVKPAIGAGSRDAASYGPDDDAAARAHVSRLHTAGRTALVQPLLASVAEHGEWPLVFLGGRYSHTANKRVTLPRANEVADLFAAETVTPATADTAQIELAQAAVDLVVRRFGTPTYARVDLVRDDDGRPCLLELELVEPSLFLGEGGPAAVRTLVDALTA